MSKSTFTRTPLILSALLAVCAALPAYAGQSDAAADARAQRQRCLSGQTNQDQATCLKEAGAALGEAKHNQLGEKPGSLAANATQRCDALPGDQRDACIARMNGAGETSGSSQAGGISRELVVPDKK